MFKKISCGMLLGIFMLLSVSANGQVGAYFGPHLGIQKPKDADRSNYLAGATLRLRFLSVIGAEGSISYREEEYDANYVTVRNWPVTVTGLLYPFPVLYGGVGAGWYHTTFDYDQMYNVIGFSDETKQETGWHLAAGAELPLSPTVKLLGDVRFVFLDYEFKDLPNVPSGEVDADFHSITLGLLFQL